jgi:hypothetical protein
MKNITSFLSAFMLMFFAWQVDVSAQYCSSGGPTSTLDSNVESVNFVGDGSSSIAYTGCAAGGVIGVEDLTNTQIVYLTAGNSYNLNIQFGTCGDNYAGAGAAWIDWNQDFIFEPSELVATWTGTPPAAQSNFLIPVDFFTYNGPTTMRVVQQEEGAAPLDPCASFEWGSVVDFGVVVSGGVVVSCPEPSFLNATNITTNSADVNWIENGSALVWMMEIAPSGSMQGAGVYLVANFLPTYPLVGLDPNVSYDFWVQSVCTPGDTSYWSLPGTFRTLCETTIAPWTETFTETPIFISTSTTCWRNGALNQENWEIGTSGEHVGNAGTIGGFTPSGGEFAWVDDSSPHSASTIFESPTVDVSALSQPALQFALIKNNEGFSNVDFSVDVWDGAAWNTDFYTNNGNTINGEWERITLSLSSLTITGAVQIRFIVGENNGTGFHDDVAIDDVSLMEQPYCLETSDPIVTNVTVTSADLGWTENGTSTSWQVEYGSTGFVQGTGNTILTGTNPLSISGLTVDTQYDYYVRAICQTGDTTSWFGPSVFSTLISPYQTPSTFKYQMVVRDASNDLVINSPVAVKTSILEGTATGSVAYSETHVPEPNTNANGLVSIDIGGGTPIAGSGTFNDIDWATGPYFIKTETDPTGGTNYTITGIQQLLSVPYALHAKMAFTANTAFNVDSTDEIQTLTISGDTLFISGGNYIILPSVYAD